jgi:hypothetical protein
LYGKPLSKYPAAERFPARDMRSFLSVECVHPSIVQDFALAAGFPLLLVPLGPGKRDSFQEKIGRAHQETAPGSENTMFFLVCFILGSI